MKSGYLAWMSILGFLISFYPLAMPRHTTHHHATFDNCYRCPPGFGVVQRCNRHRDTECRPCPEGFYSSHSSAHRPCYPCSKCGVGLYVAHHCSITNDTVCDSCHTYKGPHNQDFLEKCILPLATERPDGDKSSPESQASVAVSVDNSSAVSTRVYTAAVVAVAAVAVVVITTCYVCAVRKSKKQVNSRYVYQAVATQEAVML